jgi:hypothetical protein
MAAARYVALNPCGRGWFRGRRICGGAIRACLPLKAGKARKAQGGAAFCVPECRKSAVARRFDYFCSIPSIPTARKLADLLPTSASSLLSFT